MLKTVRRVTDTRAELKKHVLKIFLFFLLRYFLSRFLTLFNINNKIINDEVFKDENDNENINNKVFKNNNDNEIINNKALRDFRTR